MEKNCTKCGLPKPFNRFRFRTKRGYRWQQGKCMDCEALEQKERTDKIRDTKEYKDNASARAREYYKNNPEKIIEYRKTKRVAANTAYSEYRKQYWLENEEQRLKHKDRARKSFEYARDNLTDSYVIAKITQRTKLSKTDIPKELIETWRAKILLTRLLKLKKESLHLKQQ